LLIDALGAAPLVDPPPEIRWPQRSVRASLAAGVDLTIARGDGLVGGPMCGLLIGGRDVLGRITRHPLFNTWRLDALRSAALCGTLECYDRDQHGAEALPVWQLLTTPVENLRNRAERIAPQLAQVAGIAAAIPMETHSPISAALAPDHDWSSFGVVLAAADGDIRALEQRLKSLPLPIHGRIEGDRLVLDLRTVFPRQDTALVEGLAGAPASEAATTV
jgi:L-seryl-tRNA(Ser) seleniumtransferase